jgi:hypothetical protein
MHGNGIGALIGIALSIIYKEAALDHIRKLLLLPRPFGT